MSLLQSVNYKHLGQKFPQLNTELEFLVQQFNTFDPNSEGSIDLSQVMKVIRDMKQFPMDSIHELIQHTTRNANGKIEFEDYLTVICKLKDKKLSEMNSASQTTSNTNKKIIIKGLQQNTTHTINEDEKAQFVNHINAALHGDKHVNHLFPIDPYSMDIFDACKDGLLLAKLINHAVPDTIDERALNLIPSPPKPLNAFKMTENGNVVIASAKAIGCSVVNIGSQDLIDGVEYLILGLIWQIIKIGLLSKIDIKLHPELFRLLNPDESLDSFLQLPADQILLRWVNFHLKATQCPVSLTNFSTDIKNSVIYTYLLHALHPDKCSLVGIQSQDMNSRAESVLANAAKLNAAAFVTPKAIVEGNPKLNLAFVANLFNMYPGLKPLSESEKSKLDDVLFSSEGDRESRAFALWMNSLGVDPFVNNIFQDLTDGLILLQTMDIVQPGIVTWSKVNKHPVTSRFKRVENCNYCVVLGKSLKFSLVNIQGLDIVDASRTLTLGLVWQLMRAHVLTQVKALSKNAGKELTEDDLLAWANSTVSRGTGARSGPVSGLRDPRIRSGVFLVDIINGLAPNTVDYALVTEGKTDDDAKSNAMYAISMARKLGATIFVLPEDIMEGRQRLLLTFVGSLMALDK